MKRYVSWMTLGGFMASVLLGMPFFRGARSGIVAAVHAQEQVNPENRACSVATLEGAYGFYRSGTRSGEPSVPVVAVGLATFDGTGTVATARQTIRRNGVTVQDLFTDPPTAGPYEVDPDCAGRFLNPDGSLLAHIVVVDRGKELFFTSLAPGVTVTGVMKKIDSRRDREN
jgi:hypothetical protein